MPEPLLNLPPGNPPKRSLILPLVAAFLVGLVASSLWFFERGLRAPLAQVKEDATAQNKSATTTASTASFDDIVQVSDQKAGSSAVVARVAVAAPGAWVVIAEMQGGEVFRALGAARAKVPVSDLSVKLLRPTVAGKTYSVVLYRDDGDEKFELHGDSVYVDFETGERVLASFTTN